MKKLIGRARDVIFKFTIDPVTIGSGLPLHLNYEDGKYRQGELVKIIRDAIIHFALTPREFEDFMRDGDPDGASRRAWSRISKAPKNKKGDYGELLLFLILKMFFPESERFVTKVRLRSSLGDQIKGFDCAHFTIEDEQVVLWLGEAKFHQSFSSAVTDMVDSIKKHSKTSYLKDEISILAANIELNKDFPNRDKLDAVLSGSKSLDTIKFRIPILLTYDCSKLSKHSSASSDEFIEDMREEFLAKYKILEGTELELKKNFEVIFFVFPLESVKTIKDELQVIEDSSR